MDKPIRILYIDDDNIDRELVKHALHGMDFSFDLTEAQNKEDLERFIEEKSFDVVLGDDKILGYEGLEVVKAVREENAELPIILVTDTGSEETAINSLKFGVSDYVIKTSRAIQHLPHTIFSALEKQQLMVERQMAQSALKESEIKYRTLFEGTSDAVIMTDDSHLITSWNSAAQKMLQYTPKEIIGKHQSILVPDNVVSDEQEIISQVMETGFIKGFETARIAKDGTNISVEMTLSTMEDEFGNFTGIFNLIRDITERRYVENALKISEEKYRTLFEKSRDAIYITSQDGKFTDFNQAWCHLFGYKAEEINQINVIDLFYNPDDRKLFQSAIAETGRVKDLEVTYRKKNGGKMICLETASVIKDCDGNIVGYQGITRDMTESINVREQLEKALEDAQKADRMKTLFLANMSHEIRTPINAIVGFSDLIENSVRNMVNPEEIQFFDIIRDSNDRLMKTIDEVLDISSIEAMNFEVKPEQFNLLMVLKSVINEYYPKAKEKNLYIHFNTKMSRAMVEADKYCCKNALINLVDNAIKYTEEGGIRIGLNQKDNKLMLSITDTGIGISPEYEKELFEIFSQESVGYTKRYQGIGLGLALTKRYLNLNGIPIDVASSKNSGTEFIINFTPVYKPEIKVKDEGFSVPEVLALGQQGCILIVEDDQNAQNLYSYFLRSHYEMCFATSVVESKKKLKQQNVGLVLLDLSLVGDEDGLDLVRYMKKTKKYKDIPIIAATAHAYTSDRDACLTTGCDGYLAKPIKKDDLLIKINEILN